MRSAHRHAALALACFRRLGDRRGTADALATVALVHHLDGENDAALAAIAEARVALRDAPDRRAEGTLEDVAGVVYLNQGQMEDATASFERRLLAHRATGQRRGEGAILARLAYVALIEDRALDADRLAREALSLHREVRDQILEGYTLGLLGRARGHLGFAEKGRGLVANAVDVLRRAGAARLLTRTLCHLAVLSKSGSAGCWKHAGRPPPLGWARAATWGGSSRADRLAGPRDYSSPTATAAPSPSSTGVYSADTSDRVRSPATLTTMPSNAKSKPLSCVPGE